jgi:hypothetical protein
MQDHIRKVAKAKRGWEQSSSGRKLNTTKKKKKKKNPTEQNVTELLL